jgi:hypothetical protein
MEKLWKFLIDLIDLKNFHIPIPKTNSKKVSKMLTQGICAIGTFLEIRSIRN